MEFKDFQDNPQELVGKTVLHQTSFSYSDNKKNTLTKIEKVTKTGFRISTSPTILFDLIDGMQKGLNGKTDMGYRSQCSLLTDEEANQIRERWKQNRLEKELRDRMKIKVETMSFEQLQKMELL
jgi:hypothetical protein